MRMAIFMQTPVLHYLIAWKSDGMAFADMQGCASVAQARQAARLCRLDDR